MMSPAIDPAVFVSSAEPLLQRQDLEGLLALVKARWTADQVVSLLSSDNDDARKVAALALALVGGKCCMQPLVRLLRDGDPMVNQMAEYALWSIWFRCGSPEANQELVRGTMATERRDFDQAIDHFTRAIETDPTFGEAYNQRAIVHYLQEEYEDSIRDCRSAIERVPCHFGAWCGMGHSHAHLGNLPEALRCYEKALQLNPHLECIREAICELRRRLQRN